MLCIAATYCVAIYHKESGALVMSNIVEVQPHVGYNIQSGKSDDSNIIDTKDLLSDSVDSNYKFDKKEKVHLTVTSNEHVIQADD